MENSFSRYISKCCRKARDAFVLTFLLLAYHWYDGLCYVISNIFNVVIAMAIMFTILFCASLLFIYLHEFLAEKYSWDVLRLQELKHLKHDTSIPHYSVVKHVLRQMMIRGYWWILLIGSLTIGPPIVTILLRSENSPRQNILYIALGTSLSVVFWVSVWTGVGIVTWDEYVRPFFGHYWRTGRGL